MTDCPSGFRIPEYEFGFKIKAEATIQQLRGAIQPKKAPVRKMGELRAV
jgi:hypothetical protein